MQLEYVKNVRQDWRAQFFWEEASLSKIFSLFQLDLMNLFELNARLAVKLNQSFDTLYELEYLEYSLLLNIINKDIEEANNGMTDIDQIPDTTTSPSVNLPSHLKI